MARAVCRRRMGGTHHELAFILADRAGLAETVDAFADADALYRRALEIADAHASFPLDGLADFMEGRARVLRALHRPGEALTAAQ